MKKFLASVLLVASCALAQAQTPNFSENVAGIFYANCSYCHRPGSIAPFSLLTYQDAYNMRYSIQAAVTSHIMPPWPPDKSYSRLSHERLLTDAQIKTIADWVDAGAPQGDPNKAPAQPVFPEGSQLGKTDLTITIPKYTVTSTTDDYRCFAIPSGLLQQKYMSGLEVLPANGKIVHHVLVYWDTTGQCRQLDKNDPKPGYAGFGGPGSDFAGLIGGWVPGSMPIIYPKGMAGRIPKNADIIIQIHYAPGSQTQSDSTCINFTFSTAPNIREVFLAPVLNHYTSIVNGPLYIPANTVKSFTERYSVPQDVSVLSVAPHMHLIGQKIKVYSVTPVGDTTHLVRINDWDFHWQGFYEFPKLKHITKGTRLFAEATYDNTANNPRQPNSPPKNVKVGESTTDEMMVVYFAYLKYQPGDENMILDSSFDFSGINPEGHNMAGFKIYPNPSAGNFRVMYNAGGPEDISIELLDLQGRLVLHQTEKSIQGLNVTRLETDDLPAGSYFCRLVSPQGVTTEKLILFK